MHKNGGKCACGKKPKAKHVKNHQTRLATYKTRSKEMKNASRAQQIKKRLAELRPEVEMRRQLNYNIQRERQRRTFAANAQNLYDRYENATLISPHMDGLRLAGLQQHKSQLKTMLTQANTFKDPRLPLPTY